MKRTKSFLITGLSTFALLLGGCGGGTTTSTQNSGNNNSGGNTGGSGTNSKKELYISIYDGGYGSEWIEKIASDYKAKTGVTVNYQLSTSILDRIENQLDKNPEYDIYMSHDINWQNFAARDLLEPLNDLYTREVDGTGKTFEERLVPGAKELSIGENKKGQQNYYKVAYTQGAGGFVYNIDMFEKNGWTVPKTYTELVALSNKIIADNVAVEGQARKTVVPFTWSGNDRQYYWDYIMFEWWAQLAGIDKLDTIKQYKGPTGKYADGYEMYNPATYYKEFKEAYQMWYDLIAKNKSYSTTDAYAEKLFVSQAQFANGEAAMIPYAQWAKYELENATDEKLKFNAAMMMTPKAKADSKDVNYLVGFGDSMIIPSKISADSKALAKDFLVYMAGYEACATFAEKSKGAFLAFDYTDVVLSAEAQADTYISSIKNKLTNAEVFNLVSKNEITIWNTNKVMPWIENEYYYVNACSDPTKADPTTVTNSIYAKAKAGWATWLKAAALKD